MAVSSLGCAIVLAAVNEPDPVAYITFVADMLLKNPRVVDRLS